MYGYEDDAFQEIENSELSECAPWILRNASMGRIKSLGQFKNKKSATSGMNDDLPRMELFG